MATRYTNQLEEMNYDVKRWLKEGIVRAFGVCVSLRDEPDLTEQEIRERLRLFSSKPCAAQDLEKARLAFTEAQNRSIQEWKALYTEHKEKANQYFQRAQDEFAKKKALHEETIKKIKALQTRADEKNISKDSLIQGSLNFALEQLLATYSHDFMEELPCPDILKLDFETWMALALQDLQSNYEYLDKSIAKETVYKADLLQTYDEFKEFVNQEG